MTKLEKAGFDVETDKQLEQGVYVIGKKYFVMTPTFHYLGILEHIDGSVMVLSDVTVVFDTGSFAEFLKGKIANSEKMGTKRSIIDRGGSSVHEMP